ncbi:substrate-binding domain-containing protein [Amycolatopsis acidiphila]|uniref:Sugar ABC transporter substrate-binding protein n=1 Tax=Amycolatopsis acidiphila TaxID=715473 RepID=A0A557ZWC9_9PSEU|nr:substrate-binding domain-containing protein [Amycolatopsis acidiphila]TVT16305.1 sugar ABC transporter substrate-binding protein [Amycolatopsis acidiphila]UIJ56815.1 substrate-binding domain-containing protein [Amycolatopsis acidiphila]GHG54972.1 sugar ABC transporter substrate-binding protein [Amycolatopsis acidiphila]
MKRRKTLALLAAGTGVALALTACGANSSGGSSSGDQSGAASNGGPKVGVILPETATSARWAGFDQPMLQSALTKAGMTPIIENAQGDNQKFSQYADSMLSQGVKVLIIAAPSGDVGATVEQKAAQQGVPVIDYDRLNLGGSANYYVSFDNTKVGELQGTALKDALASKPGAQVIEIEGSPTDNNATLFHNGQENIVGPLYTSGALKKVASQAIDGWDNQKGGATFEQLLSANGGKVDGVLAANDGLAGAIITVLQKNGLAGKVPVTGQDASAAGLTAILQGSQYSTVFKPIQQEADAAAQLAAALIKGDTAGADAVAKDSSTDPKGNRTVKSVLLQPQSITKQNVKTVVDQGYVKASEICTADVAAACTQLGIS